MKNKKEKEKVEYEANQPTVLGGINFWTTDLRLYFAIRNYWREQIRKWLNEK